uniref:Small ribosomal subunit protein uS11 n=1 Tax=Nelumbo nucifera TaxID=4432 RepID=A0A822Z9L7_NELNU|nr:TPA_asm: hypothetical protein HUJ06_014448 [Nelumbo nucifera]
MKVKANNRNESSPYATMLAAQDVAQRCRELGITALYIKLRSIGGNKTKTPGPGALYALRALARSGMKIGRIEDVILLPIDNTRKGLGDGKPGWITLHTTYFAREATGAKNVLEAGIFTYPILLPLAISSSPSSKKSSLLSSYSQISYLFVINNGAK